MKAAGLLWAVVLPGVAAGQSRAAPDTRRSGFDFMSPQTQAIQRDDSSNPGMLWVAEGELLWQRKPAAGARACADCHGPAAQGMRGVAARYPAFDAGSRQVLDLGQRIAACRQRHQGAPTWPPEHRESLGVQAYVALQSRGLPIAPPAGPELDAARERGRALFGQRFGQLDLSCAECHDARAGLRLGGSPIPQAHPTGYPIYRLEWQGLGSLQRRLRGCLSGVRAEPFGWDSPELAALQAYLAWRARGMVMEAPAVRP